MTLHGITKNTGGSGIEHSSLSDNHCFKAMPGRAVACMVNFARDYILNTIEAYKRLFEHWGSSHWASAQQGLPSFIPAIELTTPRS